MYLIVGLGNPESDYARTRHNMGFEVINQLAKKHDIRLSRSKMQAIYGKGNIEDQAVLLVKPQTYMNASGDSVIQYMHYYKVLPEQLIVVYDDIDLEPGKIRIKRRGGPGTHNGMRSVVSKLGTEDFIRVRVGIGIPKYGDLITHVIGGIPEEEYLVLQKGINQAEKAVEAILKHGIESAMNQYN